MGQQSSQVEVPSWFRQVVQANTGGRGETSTIRFCTACEHGLCLPSEASEEEHARQYPSHLQFVFSVSEDNPLVLESVLNRTGNSVRHDHLSFSEAILDEYVTPVSLPWSGSSRRVVPSTNARPGSPARGLFNLQYCRDCRRIFESATELQEHKATVHPVSLPNGGQSRPSSGIRRAQSSWSLSRRESEVVEAAEVPSRSSVQSQGQVLSDNWRDSHEEDQRMYYCTVCEQTQYEGHAMAAVMHKVYPARTVTKEQRAMERRRKWCSRCRVTFETYDGFREHCRNADMHNSKKFLALSRLSPQDLKLEIEASRIALQACYASHETSINTTHQRSQTSPRMSLYNQASTSRAREFVCEPCGMSFTNARDLRSHHNLQLSMTDGVHSPHWNYMLKSLMEEHNEYYNVYARVLTSEHGHTAGSRLRNSLASFPPAGMASAGGGTSSSASGALQQASAQRPGETINIGLPAATQPRHHKSSSCLNLLSKGKGKAPEKSTSASPGSSSSSKPDPPGSYAYECPLCLEAHASSAESGSLEEEGLSSISCGHVFGTKCIHAALRQDPRCPLCRVNVPRGREDLRRVFL